MRPLILCLVLAFTSTVSAADYTAMIAAEIGLAVLDAPVVVPPRPAPAPTPPAPSDQCTNCKGKGKLGDGIISVTCPVCNGTGKATTAPKVAPKQPEAAYQGDVFQSRRFRLLPRCFGGRCD